MKERKWTWLAIGSAVVGAILADYGFDIDKVAFCAPGFVMIVISFGYLFTH